MNLHTLLSSAFLVTWLAASIRLAGPILLAALGETFAERSGVLNVGIEGTILLGALASFLTANSTGSPWQGLLTAMFVGIAASLLLAWMYVSVRASQVVAGLVFNVLALGVAATVYRRAVGHSSGPESIAMFQPVHLGWLSSLPILGPILFGQTVLLYLTLALVFVAQIVLFRTRFGLGLCAAGENPKAADAAGVSVAQMRYAGVLISGATAGLAGGYLVLAQIGIFRESIVAGQGFIALGIVIFGRWTPVKAALAAFVFGACDALQLSLQLLDTRLPPQLLLALPYLITILAISGVMGGNAVAPAALMIPYSKDE
jgi:simple sugar transport system permease protein